MDSFFFFTYFNWRLITLQYCGGFCHTLTWISHGCTFVPPSWTHPPTPLSCPRVPALSVLLHASNLHWLSVLHMVIHKFKCYSLKSSHPREGGFLSTGPPGKSPKLKVMFYLADKTEDLSPGGSLSDHFERLLQEAREELGYIGVFATKTR